MESPEFSRRIHPRADRFTMHETELSGSYVFLIRRIRTQGILLKEKGVEPSQSTPVTFFYVFFMRILFYKEGYCA